MLNVIIDGYTIPYVDIVSLPTVDSELAYDDHVIPSSSTVVLNNCQNKYGDTNTASVYYGIAWYDKSFVVSDDETGMILFAGKIKNFEQNDNTKTIKITASNYIKDLCKKNLVYSTTSVLIADAIRYILRYAGIPDVNVNDASFLVAAGYHGSLGLTVSLDYKTVDAKTCISVISELCKISQCGIYTINNVIYIKQWRAYNNELGFNVKNDILDGSFSSYYTDNYSNAYNIAYKVGTDVGYASSTYPGTLGDYVFNIPNEKIDSTSIDKFKILCTTITSANAAGALAISRYFAPVKVAEFTLPWDYNYLTIADQIDLTYGDYIREPIEITYIKPDSEKRTVDIKGVFRNLPVERKARDIEAPDAPYLYTVLPYEDKAVLKMPDDDMAVDYTNSRLYFSTDSCLWEEARCLTGMSPISYDPSAFPYSIDGYRFIQIEGLKPEYNYWFKATNMDISGNESSYSNKVSANMTNGGEIQYRTTGDVYFEGVKMNPLNPEGDSAPSDMAVHNLNYYGTIFYSPTAVYDSRIYQCLNHIYDEVTIRGAGSNATHYIAYQVRQASKLSEWGEWSVPELITSDITVPLSRKYFQIRCLFCTENLSTGYEDIRFYILGIK